MEFSVIYFTSAAFWTFILLAFGLGYVTANIFTRNKYRQELDQCHLEKSMLLNNVQNNEKPISEETGVKAVLTRGRSGIPVRLSASRPETIKQTHLKLDLERLGTCHNEKADDLKKIDGIGPFIEKKLNDIGIFHFEQISRLREGDIRIITELLDFFPGRILRDNWIQQAEHLHEKQKSTEEV